MPNIFPLCFKPTRKYFEWNRKKRTKDVIFWCDLKIKEKICYIHRQMSPTVSIWLIFSLCDSLFLSVHCLRACVCTAAIIERKKGQIHLSTNLTTAVFDPSSLWTLVFYIFFGIRFFFLSHSFVNIIFKLRTGWHIAFFRLLFSLCAIVLPEAQMNSSTLFMFSSTRCWWNGKQTPHKKK